MFKVSFYVKKRESVSAISFRNYWLGEHAELQMKYLDQIGVRQYLKCESLPDHPMTIGASKTYDTGPLRYDFIDHWIFNDIEELRYGSEQADVKSMMQAAYDSEDAYIDVTKSNVTMTVDLVQFYPTDSEYVRATKGSDYLKIYYPVRIHRHLTRQQAQLHWNACHGGESRQHINFSAMKKYIQAHVIDSTFVDRLAAKRGYEVDPTLIGHVEGWVSTTAEPNDLPAEESAAIRSMTMDDIDLFSDKERGSTFFAQEYYIMDNTVVTRTKDHKMPAFFSAVY